MPCLSPLLILARLVIEQQPCLRLIGPPAIAPSNGLGTDPQVTGDVNRETIELGIQARAERSLRVRTSDLAQPVLRTGTGNMVLAFSLSSVP